MCSFIWTPTPKIYSILFNHSFPYQHVGVYKKWCNILYIIEYIRLMANKQQENEASPADSGVSPLNFHTTPNTGVNF